MAWVPPAELVTWLNPEQARPLPCAVEMPPARAAPLVVTRQPVPSQSPVTTAVWLAPWSETVVLAPALIWPTQAVLPVQATSPFARVPWPVAARPLSSALQPACGQCTWELVWPVADRPGMIVVFLLFLAVITPALSVMVAEALLVTVHPALLPRQTA